MDGILFSVLAVVLFIVILGGLVLIHELGHYLVARLFGVRVLEFGIGFPPRARVLRAKGETLWTLNWLPIGGFVRLDSEDGDGGGDPRSFPAKSLPVRLAILVAGVAMNVALAFVIFFTIAWLATPVIGISIGNVDPASPAASAGIRPGDAIFAVEGERFEFFGARYPSDALRSHAGQTVQLEVRHADGSVSTIAATLRPPEQLSKTVGALGVSDLTVVVGNGYVGHNIGRSFEIASGQLTRWGGLIIGGLGQLVDGFIKDPTAAPPAAGPIGIAVSLAQIFLGSGPVMTLFVAGVLSVNLGVVNILPFPPLDGGGMLLQTLRRFAGRRFSLQAARVTYAIGALFFLVFVLWISGFDLARLGSTP